MTADANIILWILFVAGWAVDSSVAVGRELTGSPMASPDSTTVIGQDIMLGWLKITAVPLGVFLMGACTWGCIKNSVVWRSFTGRRVAAESNRPEADEVRLAERSNYSTHDGSDHLEEGIVALSLCGMDAPMDDGSAMPAQTLLTTQQPSSLQSPIAEGNGAATAGGRQ